MNFFFKDINELFFSLSFFLLPDCSLHARARERLIECSSSAHRSDVTNCRAMDEYTGPIGLYAYLAHRSKVAPIMLRRNLSYRREVYEAERRRINAEVNGKTPICIAKSDKVEPCQDSGKERAAERATDSDIGDRADAKRDAPEDQMHSTGGAGSAGARRAPDGDQQCSRRSMQSVKKNAVVFRLRYQQGQHDMPRTRQSDVAPAVVARPLLLRA